VEIDEVCASIDAHEVSVYPWFVDGEYSSLNVTLQSGCKFVVMLGKILKQPRMVLTLIYRFLI
jgi:hypothetical protein